MERHAASRQSNARKSRQIAVLSTAAGIALACSAVSAQSIWTGTATDVWSDATKWSAGVPNATDAIVTIDATTTGKVQMDGLFTVGTLNISRASTLETAPTTFDPTKGLTLAVTTGVPTVNVTAGSTFFYGSLNGTQGFTKTGSGNFTFRFNALDQTYSGPININGGVLGIQQNSSLGNDDNDIAIANGARLTAEPGSNSGVITLPSSRSITLNGTQSQFGVNNVNVNFVIEGAIGGLGGLTKVDPGKLSLNGAITYAGPTRVVGGIVDFNTPGGAVSLTGEVLLQGGVGTQLDFSDLTSLDVQAPGANFNVLPNTTAGTTPVYSVNVLLAKNGTSTFRVNNWNTGGAAGSSQGESHIGETQLGTNTDIGANAVRIGGFNGRGQVVYQAGVTPGTFKLRGVDGVAPIPLVTVGETSSGVRSGLGILNLTGATVDVLATEVRIGRHIANSSNSPGNSRILMSAGTFKVTTLVMSDKAGTGDVNANSAPTLRSEFLQTGGTVEANTILMGRDALGGPTPPNPFLFSVMQPVYNLNGGVLKAASIIGGPGNFNSSSTLTLGIAGGTLQNLDANTDLVVNGRDAGAGGRINVVIGDNGGTISADADRSVTLTANTVVSGAGTLTKAGPGTLIINTTVGDAVNVVAGTLGGNATIGRALTAAANTTISPGASIGTLSAETANLAGALSIEYADAGGTDTDGQIDKIVTSGELNISAASVVFSDFAPTSVLNDASYIFASYGSLVGQFTSVSGLPNNFELRYGFNGNNIALVFNGPSFVLGDFGGAESPDGSLNTPDGDFNEFDVEGFLLALNDQSAYLTLNPTLGSSLTGRGDFGGAESTDGSLNTPDGDFNEFDVEGFLLALNDPAGYAAIQPAPRIAAIPEPAALGLLAPMGLLLARRRR